MKARGLFAIALVTIILATAMANAQQSPAARPDLNAIPEKMPFNIPYGPSISIDRAQSLVQTAIAEAKKRRWEMNVAVADQSGDLKAFGRMDGAMLASISLSQHKARARRDTAGRRAISKMCCKSFASITF